MARGWLPQERCPPAGPLVSCLWQGEAEKTTDRHRTKGREGKNRHNGAVASRRRAMSDFDSPWKEAIDLYFERFLAFFFSPVHAEIDWGRPFEMLDKELQQIMPEAEV